MDLLSDIPQSESGTLLAPMAVPSVFTLPSPISPNWTSAPTSSVIQATPPTTPVQAPPAAPSSLQATPSAVPATPAFLPWSPLICNCISGEHLDGQFLYTWYRSHGMDKCTWFIRAKKAEADRIVKQYERESTRQDRTARLVEKEAQLATKRKELGFTCRRCSAGFDSNTKLHEHVRGKHSKKPKEPVGEQKPSPPPTTVALATPPSSPSPPPATSVESPALPAPISPPITPLAATPRKPISWSEIASRPNPTMPSRLPRLTVKYGLPTPLPTPPLSPILQPQESTNSSTKRPSTTPVEPHLTVEDLYIRFHGKPKPSSLCTTQNGLQPAPSSGQMRPRQMRITSYFKPASSSPEPKAKLASARKYVDSRAPGQAVKNGDLALSRPVAGYVQQSTSSDMPHRHSDHCNRGTKGWSRADLSLSKSIPLSRRASPSPAFASHSTQQFTFSDKSHRHSGHCSKGTKGWSCADSSSSKRAPIAEDSARHTCRRCTQRFTPRNLLHRHLRHCFQRTQRWPPAVNGLYPPPSLHQWGSFNNIPPCLPALRPALGECFYGLSPPLHYV